MEAYDRTERKKEDDVVRFENEVTVWEDILERTVFAEKRTRV